MSLEKTYRILQRSNQDEVANVLGLGVNLGDSATRDVCIETLADRDDDASHRILSRSWSRHRDAIIGRLKARKDVRTPWFDSIIESIQNPELSGLDLATAAEIAAELDLSDALPHLVELANHHDQRETREVILESVLSLSQNWGSLARNQYAGTKPSPTLERERLRMMEQFQSIYQNYQRHRCEKLIDAMLTLATWNDPALQSILKQDTPSRKVLLRRMRSSQIRGVVILLAGYLRRRSIPEPVIGVMWQRDDVVFREFLLRAVSASPNGTIIQHLQEFGLPDCLRGGTQLVEQIDRAHDASLAQAYSAAMGQNPETLLVILELIERQTTNMEASNAHSNEQVFASFAQSLHRCERPSLEFWLHAMNSPLMDGDLDAPHNWLDPQSDLAARICRGLVALSQKIESPLAQVATELLSELNIQQVLPLFRKLSPIQRLRLGRILIQIDGQTIEVVQDGLRHAVMQRRLESIEFAKTLGLVDLMVEPLAAIARGDHQIVRMAATGALADAHSEASADLLRELSRSEQPSLSDAAREALQTRGLTR